MTSSRLPIYVKRAANLPWAVVVALSLGVVMSWLLSPSRALAQGIFAERWWTIETEHFRVHYHEGVEPIAREVAEMCEQAHTLLAPIFGHVPTTRTEVILVDGVDGANGSAGVIPRNLIRLQAMAPESGNSLGYYDNWMWNLIVHEYVHILHIDTMGSAFRFLNTPLGKRIAPNQALPRWLIEGIATYHESVQTGRGRVNSALFQMYVRAGVLDRVVPSLGQLTGIPTRWPQATGWYLYGSFFIAYIAETRGWDAMREFIHVYGRRVLPYGINVSARQTLGDDFQSLWQEWNTAALGEAVAAALVTRIDGQTTLGRFTTRGHRTTYVTVDRGTGRPAWLLDDGHSRLSVVRADPPTLVGRAGPAWDSASTRRSHVEGDGEFDFLDSDHIVISQMGTIRQAYAFRDLYAIDLRDGTARRLTYGARAREPRVSPDGQTVLYVAPVDGRTDLFALDLATGETRVVLEAEPWGQLSRPSFLPGGGSVVASYLRPGHGRDLVLVDITTGEVRWLTDDDAFDLDPWVSACGRYVVFASDRTGAFDIYVMRLSDGEVRRLTRMESGAFSPAVVAAAEGGWWLYVSTYGSDGFDAAYLHVAGDLFEDAAPAPSLRAREIVDPPPLTTTIAERRRYPPLESLRPLRWSPTATSADGDTLAGLTMTGGDPAGRWSYALATQWTFRDDNLVWAMDANTSVLPVGVGLSTTRRYIPRSRSLIAESREIPSVEQETAVSLRTAVRFSSYRASHSFGTGYTYQLNRPYRLPELRHRPEDISPRVPDGTRFDSLNLGWGWSRAFGSSHGISTEEGTALSLSTRFRSTNLGADVDSAELTYSARHYIRMPYHEHHVLALRTTGGLGRARGVGRRLFGVGGPSPQDVLLALVESTPAGSSHVRGFRPNARIGDRFYLVNAEYRLPLANLNLGYGTLPLFFRRLSVAGFVDAGDAYDGVIDIGNLLVGVGGELRLSASLGYFQGAAFRLGVARGIGSDGITSVYMLYGFAF